MKTKEHDKKSGTGADIVFECLRCAEGAGWLGRALSLDLSLRGIADPKHRGSAPSVDLRIATNEPGMSMKTKEEDKQSGAGADWLGRALSLDLSLRDIADPRHRGLRHPSI